MITLLDITSKEQFSKNKKMYNFTQLSEHSGINKNTLKTWFHRYSLSSNIKDDKGNFLYSEEELQKFNKEIIGPGDKSISIRFVLLASQAIGKSVAYNILRSQDVLSALNAIKKLLQGE